MDAACPKCGAPRTGAEACPRCGVVFARFDAAALDAGVPDDLKALWAHVEAGWEERARHALFTETAIARGEAAYAAARYRARGADPIAVEQLARLAARLEQALAQTAAAGDARRAEGPSWKRAAAYLLIVLAFLAVSALGLALVLR